jgi:hypothetical protein
MDPRRTLGLECALNVANLRPTGSEPSARRFQTTAESQIVLKRGANGGKHRSPQCIPWRRTGLSERRQRDARFAATQSEPLARFLACRLGFRLGPKGAATTKDLRDADVRPRVGAHCLGSPVTRWEPGNAHRAISRARAQASATEGRKRRDRIPQVSDGIRDTVPRIPAAAGGDLALQRGRRDRDRDSSRGLAARIFPAFALLTISCNRGSLFSGQRG